MARKLALVVVLSLLTFGALSLSATKVPVSILPCSCGYCTGPNPNVHCNLGSEVYTCAQYYVICG